MTDDRAFERATRDWLEAGSDRAPAASLDAVLLAVRTTPQERDLRIPWRLPTMSSLSRFAALAITVVVIGAAAALLLRPGNDTGVGPAPSPSPTATPPDSPSATQSSPVPSPSGVPTQVDAQGFVVPFQISWEIPMRTTVKTDVVDMFSGTSGMNVFNVDKVGRDPCHSNDLLATPLTTPQQFMDWLATIPKVTVGQVTPVIIAGQSALRRAVTVGTLSGCIDPGYLHSGIVSQYGAGGYYMTSGEEELWTATEVRGKLIAIAIWPHGGTTLGGAATRALGTLQFTP